MMHGGEGDPVAAPQPERGGERDGERRHQSDPQREPEHHRVGGERRAKRRQQRAPRLRIFDLARRARAAARGALVQSGDRGRRHRRRTAPRDRAARPPPAVASAPSSRLAGGRGRVRGGQAARTASPRHATGIGDGLVLLLRRPSAMARAVAARPPSPRRRARRARAAAAERDGIGIDDVAQPEQLLRRAGRPPRRAPRGARRARSRRDGRAGRSRARPAAASSAARTPSGPVPACARTDLATSSAYPPPRDRPPPPRAAPADTDGAARGPAPPASPRAPPTTTKPRRGPRRVCRRARGRIAERDDEDVERRAPPTLAPAIAVGAAEAGERPRRAELSGTASAGWVAASAPSTATSAPAAVSGAERGGAGAVGAALVGERAAEPGKAHPGAAAEAKHVVGRERRHGGDRGPEPGRVSGSGAGERRRRADVGQRAVEERGSSGAAYGRATRASHTPRDSAKNRLSSSRALLGHEAADDLRPVVEPRMAQQVVHRARHAARAGRGRRTPPGPPWPARSRRRTGRTARASRRASRTGAGPRRPSAAPGGWRAARRAPSGRAAAPSRCGPRPGSRPRRRSRRRPAPPPAPRPPAPAGARACMPCEIARGRRAPTHWRARAPPRPRTDRGGDRRRARPGSVSPSWKLPSSSSSASGFCSSRWITRLSGRAP